MELTQIIDGRGKINAKMLKELLSFASTSDEVDIMSESDSWLEVCTTKDFIDKMFTHTVPNDKNIELTITYAEHALIFTGKDFNWFLKDDRLAELKRKVYKQPKVSTDNAKSIADTNTPAIKTLKLSKAEKEATMLAMCHVAIAYEDNNTQKIEEYRGKKRDCITWLNNKIVMHANIKGDVTMLFCIDADDEDRQWLTLKELFDAGEIELG